MKYLITFVFKVPYQSSITKSMGASNLKECEDFINFMASVHTLSYVFIFDTKKSFNILLHNFNLNSSYQLGYTHILVKKRKYHITKF